MKRFLFLLFYLFAVVARSGAETGYELWLRYNKVSDPDKLNGYRKATEFVYVAGNSETSRVIKDELNRGLSGLLGKSIRCNSTHLENSSLILVAETSDEFKKYFKQSISHTNVSGDGFSIVTVLFKGRNRTVISAKTEIGLLYGAFRLLRNMQTNEFIDRLIIKSTPSVKLRLLDHWDNLNRTVERGYAGFSLWNWHTLPGYIDQRYIDYARANASIGINGTVLTNVNANATILTKAYLEKVKALADVFRPYGIRVYLTARFSAPIEIGGLKTADPLDEGVREWWKEKVKEIYSYIPDFGGFLVKANSEGQPGPQDYKRTHADGANMLADAVAPFNGIVMWRAFVYSAENPVDRHKQAYDDFVPLDGKFRDNVMVQVKNGAIDFMPREPFHPLFGAMPKTPLMMEFQITQEYLGQGTNLVYLAPLFKEVLESDTYYKGKGSTVAKVIEGTLDKHDLTGMAGVANIGNDINWCGHPFAQANWYAFGRLAWSDGLTSEQIAEEWLRMTYSNDASFIAHASKMMMQSRDIMVQYSNPIGLHHIMATGHHYGPGPWVNNLNRPEWNPVYYHKADSFGIGFNRTATGSNALAQYYPEARKLWEDSNTCEEKNLLWFHHVSWNHKMKSGRTLWQELCFQYYTGAERVKQMQQKWESLKPYIDKERFEHVRQLLVIQYDEAIWWRNSCLLYFQTFSKQPIPATYEQPDKSLEYYKSIRILFAPGN